MLTIARLAASLQLPAQLAGNFPYTLQIGTGAALVANYTGTVFDLRSPNVGRMRPGDQRWWAQIWGNITAAPGGAVNTVAIYILTSAEGTHWQKVGEIPTGILSNVSRTTEIIPLIGMLRFVAVVAIVANNPVYDLDVQICSDAPITQQGLPAVAPVVNITDVAAAVAAPDVDEKHGRINIAIAGTQVALVFAAPFSSANYTANVTGENAQANTPIWIEAKLLTGFEIHCAAAPVGIPIVCNWRAIHD